MPPVEGNFYILDLAAGLGTRGTNQRGTTFGACNLELMLLGHTANGVQSQKGHRVIEHNHWGTESKGAQGNGAQPLGQTKGAPAM